jgi:pilus assembly protein Flp/PilA
MIEQFLAYAMRRRNDDGASAVEYGLLVALIAAIIVGVVATLGGTVKAAFTKTSDGMSSTATATT